MAYRVTVTVTVMQQKVVCLLKKNRYATVHNPFHVSAYVFSSLNDMQIETKTKWTRTISLQKCTKITSAAREEEGQKKKRSEPKGAPFNK